jgi:predicted  nucleic acid-binding Zn-ribbon protein
MSEFDELKSKINHLEYDEIKPIKEDISDIKLKMNTNDLLTKQAVENNERLSNAIDTLKTTMIEISQSVKDSNRINGEITKTIEELNKKISSVEVRISEIDDKSKLDIVIWLKNNWFGIVGILGILYTVIKTII